MIKIAAAAAIGAAGLAMSAIAPVRAQETLAVASYGGAYQEALRKAFYTPTEKRLGVTIKDYTLSSIADIRTQVKAGAVQWDVVELYSGQCQQAANEGLLETLDYKVITTTSGVPKDLVKEHWIGFTAYSTVLAWNKKVYKTPPTSWADFWDTKKFPGTRALGGYGLSTTGEIALLSDGVPVDKMYPIDQDRAFKKLAEIKPSITAWWTSGAKAAQLAQSEEADMLSIWVARIDAAIKQGAPYDYTYNQAIMDIECLVVPKGAKNKDLAMKAINAFLDPNFQADLMNYVPYGPVNLDAYKTGRISAEKLERANTSPDNFKKHVVQNKEYWAANGQKAQERWDQFMQKK